HEALFLLVRDGGVGAPATTIAVRTDLFGHTCPPRVFETASSSPASRPHTPGSRERLRDLEGGLFAAPLAPDHGLDEPAGHEAAPAPRAGSPTEQRQHLPLLPRARGHQRPGPVRLR